MIGEGFCVMPSELKLKTEETAGRESGTQRVCRPEGG